MATPTRAPTLNGHRIITALFATAVVVGDHQVVVTCFKKGYKFNGVDRYVVPR